MPRPVKAPAKAPAKVKATRAYRSPMRTRGAALTRQRIVEAGRARLAAEGYEGMTVEAIAKDAGVSAQTVYAVFGSKRGILAGILEQTAFSPRYHQLVEEAMQTKDPAARIRFAAAIARQIYDATSDVLALIGVAAVVAPELSSDLRDRDHRRYQAQGKLIDALHAARRLRKGLDAAAAHDILWALTSRDIYRMLVQERGWSSERYETWLARTLEDSLVGGGLSWGTRKPR